jgi:hypothetical protein
MIELRSSAVFFAAITIFFAVHNCLYCQQGAQQKMRNSLKIIELLVDSIKATSNRGLFVRRCLDRVHEIDIEFRNYGFTAQEYLNVFCTPGPRPEDSFEFLAAYVGRGPNISHEQELWDIDRKMRETHVQYLEYVKRKYAEIKHLYAQGIDPDACDRDGSNLLIMASAAGSTSLVEDIYNTSPTVDINAKNAAGWSALSLAVALGQCDIVVLLLGYGANPLITYNQKPLTEIICARDHWPNREMRKRKIAELLAPRIIS